MNITRSAFIAFSPWTAERPAMILVGKNRSNCLTTIGGRKENGETEQLCLIREVLEETKGVINFHQYPELLSSAIMRKYENCQYYFTETTYEVLLNVQEEFKLASSDRDVCNELNSLEVVSIETLAEDFIVNKSIPAHPNFQNMFLDIGFDTIVKRRTTYFVKNIGARVDLKVAIDAIPKIVSVFPTQRGLPIVYGIVIPNGIFITDQYYFRNERGMLFRNGFSPDL